MEKQRIEAKLRAISRHLSALAKDLQEIDTRQYCEECGSWLTERANGALICPNLKCARRQK